MRHGGIGGAGGETFLNSLFCCVSMYVMNYGDTPPNALVEIARWTAPLATASGVVLAIGTLRTFLGNRVKYLRGGSVAVYGPEEEKEKFLQQLDSRGINGQDELIQAQRYILAGEETENFAFYQKYRTALQGRNVYLKCRSLPAQSIEDPNLKLFCPEETAARLYWKQRGLYELSVKKGHDLKIVLLGFEKLGQEILLRGLQSNIFSPNQRIEYHVFGDGSRFAAVYRGLGAISDPVVFHSEEWYDQLELIEQADLVLVLSQQGQEAMLQDLLLATRREEIDVFASDAFGTDVVEDRQRLRLYNWEQEGCRLPRIFDDLLLERAKRINLRYCHLYGGTPETEDEKEKQWRQLDAFTRYSNISSADYHEIRLLMLEAMGLPLDGSGISAEQLELLSELEHIRWCRYHYLNNWRYGQPENGKRKDKTLRIHADLVEYQTLTEAEKEKDRENIRILLSVRSV